MRAWSVLGGAVDVQRVDHHGDGVSDRHERSAGGTAVQMLRILEGKQELEFRVAEDGAGRYRWIDEVRASWVMQDRAFWVQLSPEKPPKIV
jgi:hypothetical protein